jgi:hypothetical protein
MARGRSLCINSSGVIKVIRVRAHGRPYCIRIAATQQPRQMATLPLAPAIRAPPPCDGFGPLGQPSGAFLFQLLQRLAPRSHNAARERSGRMNAQQQIHRVRTRPAAERRCFFLPASDVFRPPPGRANAWAGSIAPEAEIIGPRHTVIEREPERPSRFVPPSNVR